MPRPAKKTEKIANGANLGFEEKAIGENLKKVGYGF